MKSQKKKFFLKPSPAKIGEINYHIFDRFTFVHLIIGCIYGVWGIKFWLMICLAIVWELIENPLKANFPSIFPHGSSDTIQNAVSDCIAVCLGWTLITYLVNVI